MARILPEDAVALIKQLFPDADNPNFNPAKQVADRLAAVLDVIDQVPSELILLDSPRFGAFVANRAALRQVLSGWTQGTDLRGIAPVKGFDKNPIVVVREALAACPEQAVPATTPELAFISDPDLRAGLRADLSEMRRALLADEHKAATVLGGSVLEALLLWALQEREKNAPGDISASRTRLVASKTLAADPGADLTSREWSLHHYIEVAADLKIIKDAAAKQARLAKGYRDLIHPARVIRIRQPCNRGTAYGAVAAVELVIEDLKGP